MTTHAQEEACEDTVFSINLLSPNTNVQRNAWSALMEEEFPKACIGVASHLNTDWTTIAARTWAFDVSTTSDGLVPNYENGGFDVLFVGYSNPTAPVVTVDDLYHSNQFAELGGFNFYHFDNSSFDAAHEAYAAELDATKREPFAKTQQAILYEEQPSLTLLYPESLWAYTDDLTLSKDQLFGLSNANFVEDYATVGISGVDDLVYAHSYPVAEFSVQTQASYIAAQYMNAIWQGLYTLDLATKDYKPLLAASLPTWNSDNTVATVELRDDVTFADGSTMNATDVVESFKRIMDPNYADGAIASFVTYFGNTTLSGGTIDIDDVVTANSEFEVEFTFQAPYFLAVSLLGFYILPTSAYGTQANPSVASYDFNGEIVNGSTGIADLGWGTGPYVYGDIDGTSGNIELAANTNYWDGTVTSDKISFTQYAQLTAALEDLKSGAVHIMDSQLKPAIADVDGVTGVEWDTVIDFGWQEIAINNQHPILGTGTDTPLGQEDPSMAKQAAKWVRQAMSHAIPRQTIIDEIVEGLASPGVVAGWAPGTQGYDSTLAPYEYSLSKAKELLEMAGL